MLLITNLINFVNVILSLKFKNVLSKYEIQRLVKKPIIYAIISDLINNEQTYAIHIPLKAFIMPIAQKVIKSRFKNCFLNFFNPDSL